MGSAVKQRKLGRPAYSVRTRRIGTSPVERCFRVGHFPSSPFVIQGSDRGDVAEDARPGSLACFRAPIMAAWPFFAPR